MATSSAEQPGILRGRAWALPKAAEVMQDITFCGLGCGLENFQRLFHASANRVCNLELSIAVCAE